MDKKYDFKSKEEKWFSWYLDELKEHGLIEDYTYEEVVLPLTPKVTFPYVKETKLKTKVKKENKTKTLFQPMTYTPDFVINFEPSATIIANKPEKFPLFITSNSTLTAFIDVKSEFRSNRASDVRFPDRKKFVYHLHRIYVNEIKINTSTSNPTKLFEETFTPKKIIETERYLKDCRWGKKGESKIKYKTRSIEEWLKTL